MAEALLHLAKAGSSSSINSSGEVSGFTVLATVKGQESDSSPLSSSRKTALVKAALLRYWRRTRPKPGLSQTCAWLQRVEDGRERITDFTTIAPASLCRFWATRPWTNPPPSPRFLVKVPGVENHPILTAAGTSTGSASNKRLRL